MGDETNERPALPRDVDPSTAAADEFLAAARARAAAAEREAQPAGRDRPHPTVLLAGLLALVLIVGGGFLVFSSLTGDGDGDNDSEAAVGDEDAADEPEAAEESPGEVEPTAIAPTPSWQPVADGPTVNPFTYTLVARTTSGEGPFLLDGPEGEPVSSAPIAATHPSGAPVVLRVLDGEPGDSFVQVAMPSGSERLGWVETAAFEWRSTNVMLEIDVSINRLRIFDGNELIHEARIASGRWDRPTTARSTWVAEVPAVDRNFDGGIAILLVAEADAADSQRWIRAVEVAPDADDYTTDGTVIIGPDTVASLPATIVPGATVEFVGQTPPPTPTPVPTPFPTPFPTLEPRDSGTRPPSSSASGGTTRCPAGARGAPPNCYRVVERPTIDGPCESGTAFSGSCWLLAGTPTEINNGNASCRGDQELRGSNCWLEAGPIPKVPGPCPGSSTEVDGECRVPL